MSNTPKISIIVPIYNVEQYLKECLDSILKQTFSDFELILVNDCSPDNSQMICEEYLKKDNRIKLINKLQNEGLPQARKTGFENSCGEYIVNIDSDDWVEPVYLEYLYNIAVKENADLVCCDFYMNYPDKYIYMINTKDTNNRLNNLGFVSPFSAVTYIYRRDLYEKILFPIHPIGEDCCITQQALFYSNKLSNASYPLYHYRIHSESMSKNKKQKQYMGRLENIHLTIDFLKQKLQNNYSLIEKNIYPFINRFKYSIISDKNLRKNKNLYKFCPESKFKNYYIKRKLKDFSKFIMQIGKNIIGEIS